jgi:uncharacterized protein YozE (UPF0346 family)
MTSHSLFLNLQHFRSKFAQVFDLQRICSEFSRNLRDFTRICEILREFARFYENLRDFTRICEILREFARFYENLRDFTRICGKCREVSRNLRKFSICNECSEVFHQSTCRQKAPRRNPPAAIQRESQPFSRKVSHFREKSAIFEKFREIAELWLSFKPNARYLCLWERCGRSASTKKHCGTDFSLALSI